MVKANFQYRFSVKVRCGVIEGSAHWTILLGGTSDRYNLCETSGTWVVGPAGGCASDSTGTNVLPAWLSAATYPSTRDAALSLSRDRPWGSAESATATIGPQIPWFPCVGVRERSYLWTRGGYKRRLNSSHFRWGHAHRVTHSAVIRARMCIEGEGEGEGEHFNICYNRERLEYVTACAIILYHFLLQ